MTVLDPGHSYALSHLDGNSEELLTFVKREGVGYPGNVGSHPGTTLQECWRTEIHRLKYLQNQLACEENEDCINWLRHCILRLEQRAAQRHGRALPELSGWIENQPTCPLCGHICCNAACAQSPQPSKEKP